MPNLKRVSPIYLNTGTPSRTAGMRSVCFWGHHIEQHNQLHNGHHGHIHIDYTLCAPYAERLAAHHISLVLYMYACSLNQKHVHAMLCDASALENQD